jgi:UDP-N-acetylmuramoyl-L-alanyl-D-glutamate--2,6-diaminopimelate ligase
MKKMNLKTLLGNSGSYTVLQGAADMDITDIAESASTAKKGSVFFCVRGIKKDGHDFIPEAVKNGVSAIIVENDVRVKEGTAVIRVKNAREAMFYAADKFYAGEKKKVSVIAITGTKGKTTVSYLIDALLKQQTGRENAVVGTIGYRIGKKHYPAGNTTPSNIKVHKLIAMTARAGIKYFIIEASSEALDQGRLRNIDVDSVVVTNVTRDHFDYHKNFANYLKAKMIVISNMKKGGRFVVNIDSKGSREMVAGARAKTADIITCSTKKKAGIRLLKYSLDIKGTDFTLDVKGKKMEISTELVGMHNIYNIMSAIGAVKGIVSGNNMIKALADFKTVDGRLDRAYSGEFDVIVDYAHTPDSMEKTLTALNALKKGRVITVFGAGGNKDRGKRPLMGAIAEKLSDEVIVTSDNPRYEEPGKIIADIMNGVRRKKDIMIVPDRRLAIAAAVKKAVKDDIVLIAGKGHETYQEIKGKRHPFEDKKVALEMIKKHRGVKKIYLSGLLKNMNYSLLSGSTEIEIKGVEDNSRRVKKGFLFIAVKGFSHDGHDYIAEAVKRGAAAVLVEKKVRVRGAAVIKVKNTREALFKITDRFFSGTKGKIKIIGVTGTNGKTTAVYMTDGILRAEYGGKNAVAGTIEYKVGKNYYPSINTTPSNVILHRLIEEAVGKKLKYFIMEVSSHALDQDRIKNIELDTAVVTNVTRDHFDYHKNFRNYLAAKLKIVDAMREGGRLVINLDDASSGKFIAAAKKRRLKILTYSLNKKRADIKPVSYSLDINGVTAELDIKGSRETIRCNLPGIHNLYNMMSAVGACLNEARIKSIKRGIENLKSVNGRTEMVYDGNFKVMVDYAHTPDALEQVLSTLAKVKKGRLITVFGAPGNRDRGKRPLMGKVAEKLSDTVIITSDNTENEKPMDIINEVLGGVRNPGKAVVEPDRRKAIRLAIGGAKPGDVVLIAGKGHEKYQDIMGKKSAFEDKNEALKALKAAK